MTKEISTQNEPISPDEIKKTVDKIREEYTKYSPLHPSGFKLLEFESRYTQILREKGDIEKFLLTEIDFLEKMKSLYNVQKKKAEIIKNSPIGKILDEQEQKYAHFPKIEFHPFARREMKFFYGAVKRFVDRELGILELIFKGTPEMGEFKDSVALIEKTGKSFRNNASIRITEHILKITEKNGDPDFVEKESQLIIKDTCIGLKNLEETIQKLISEKRINPELTLSFPYQPDREEHEQYRNISFGAALNMISEACREILIAFRMEWLYLSKKP